MKYILLLFVIIYTPFCFAGSFDTIPANDNFIEYTGRIDFKNPLSPTFSYSGVSIRACFTGTSIAMIMNDNVGQNYYNIILDGELIDNINITTGEKTYPIAEGLNDSIHEIEIFKRTEEMFGKTQFFGFVVDEGASLVEIQNTRSKLIEFIGNSITCGYGNEGELGGTFGPTTENHYLTYAAITSRNFNARHLAVCKSGIGIYRNYDGPADGNADCMTNFYTRTFLYDENPKYSFSEKPDLVCINLGTNDFSTTEGDSAKYVSNYFRLIDTIQSKYSMPDIICLAGPMLSDPALTEIRNYLTFIADSATKKGKGNVYFFEMSQQGDLGLAIDYHPTIAQHKKNALELTEYIQSLKGWEINPLLMNATVVGAKHVQLEFNTPVQDSTNTLKGFKVYNNNTQYPISNVYSDTNNNKLIHIILQESISIGEIVKLDYTPGNIKSVDSIKVEEIKSMIIQNNLTETKITKGTTNEEGTEVTLTCNKNVKKNSTIEGLSLSNSKGDIAIVSFSISNKKITLYINEVITMDESVFASYNGTNIYSEDDVPLSDFSKVDIKNNSTIITNVPINNIKSIEIYPNPNHSGIFYYCIDKSAITGIVRLELVNMNGTIIQNQIISETEGKIDMSNNVLKGMYFIKLLIGNNVIAKSIIIE